MMELLGNYADDDGAEAGSLPPVNPNTILKRPVELAPLVRTQQEVKPLYIDPYSKEVAWNPKADLIFAPVQGPVDPNMRNSGLNYTNSLTGQVEPLAVNDYSFNEQYHTFHHRRFAVDPNGNGRLIGDSEAIQKFAGQSVFDQSKKAEKSTTPKMKRQRRGESDSADFKGPWAPFELMTMPLHKFEGYVEGPKTAGPETEAAAAAATAAAEGAEKEPPKEGAEAAATTEEPKAPEAAAAEVTPAANKDKHWGKTEEEIEEQEAMDDQANERSILHIPSARDYQGRSWLHVPSDLKNKPHDCFVPKKQIHTWSGHTKGVSKILFFPNSGHLLLSAGLDNQLLIWDVYNHNRGLVRSYIGHSRGVRDICFNSTGTRFLSAGLDRKVRLWDTETGQCLGRYSTGKTPICVKFHPEKENEFLVGQTDKKIMQWDIAAGKWTLEYDQHLGAVNTLTFVDQNRRFVSTSDDKSVRVWEYGIPVVIKYIAEPHMHSMPVISLSPDGSFFLGQSLDNQILVYNTSDKFKINKKKRFAGHINAGYACGLGMSPDSKFVMSGDASGKLWIWDWKTTRILKTIPCHDGVLSDCEWHPIEPSRVATCGWDGRIKYWD